MPGPQSVIAGAGRQMVFNRGFLYFARQPAWVATGVDYPLLVK